MSIIIEYNMLLEEHTDIKMPLFFNSFKRTGITKLFAGKIIISKHIPLTVV